MLLCTVCSLSATYAISLPSPSLIMIQSVLLSLFILIFSLNECKNSEKIKLGHVFTIYGTRSACPLLVIDNDKHEHEILTSGN